jgi:arylsulfatase A-like enzyme
MPSAYPNILFVFADQHRYDWVGTNPDIPVRTPNVCRLGERGTQFTNAVTPSPVCAAARASLAGGVEYPRSPVKYNGDDFPLDHRSLYRRLRDEAGYHVTGCGKFDLAKNTYEWGIDGSSRLKEWGFSDGLDVAGQVDAALSYALDQHPASLPSQASSDWELDEALERVQAGEEPHDPYGAYLAERGLLESYIKKHRDKDGAHVNPLPGYAFQDEWIGRRAMDLLWDLPEEQPWFLQVNFGGPHPPFDVTREMHGWYRDPDVTFPPPTGPGADSDSHDQQEIRRNYAAKIELIDRWVGQYVARLDDRGELENTVIVYTSDHGEMLGDYGNWGKGQPDHPSLGVPMIIAGPGIEADVVSETPVSVLDLHRTFCDFAGIESNAEGRSLRPLLGGNSSADFDRELVYSALDDWELVFDGQFKLVERNENSESRILYEVTADGEIERAPEEYSDQIARLADGLEDYRNR